MAHHRTEEYLINCTIEHFHVPKRQLGFYITYQGMNWTELFQVKKEKLNIRLRELEQIGFFNTGLTTAIKLHIFRVWVLPIIDFGLCVLNPFDPQIENAHAMLETLFLKGLKIALGVSRWTSTAIITSLLKGFNICDRWIYLYSKRQNMLKVKNLERSHLKFTMFKHCQKPNFCIDYTTAELKPTAMFDKVGALSNLVYEDGSSVTPKSLLERGAHQVDSRTNKFLFEPVTYEQEKCGYFETHKYVDCLDEKELDGVRIYTDGSLKKGNGGFGIVIVNKDNQHHQSLCYSLKYDYEINRIELLAICTVLYNIKKQKFDLLRRSFCPINILSDSKNALLCISLFQKNDWFNPLVYNNLDLLLQVKDELNRVDINFQWTKGHNKNLFQELVDFEANCARVDCKKYNCSNLEETIQPPIVTKGKVHLGTLLGRYLVLPTLINANFTSDAGDQEVLGDLCSIVKQEVQLLLADLRK